MVNVLSKHNDLVNCVRWIKGGHEYLLSTSSDRTSLIWEKTEQHRYQVKWTLAGCKDAAIVGDFIRSKDAFITAVSSNDLHLRLWHDDQLVLTKNVGCFLFDIHLYDNLIIPGLIVVTAGSNERVDINRFDGTSLETLISLKGHQDWIKSLDLYSTADKLMLASSSQDFLIRVYAIEPTKDETEVHQQSFSVDDHKFTINLDTVLAGHEGWVNGVKWYLEPEDQKLYLLSSSMDKTIILWEQLDSAWNEKHRLGEVGGNSIGFIGCSIEDGFICAYAYTGAIHIWRRNNAAADVDGDDNRQVASWVPSIPVTGHFNEVSDLVWEPQGEYFLTCSVDQTTRLHSYWANAEDGAVTWHEIARPQIHGYDLKCLAMTGRGGFVSGADEKVLRVFEASRLWIESIQQISGLELHLPGDMSAADCAKVPALGLSNAAVYGFDSSGEALNCPPSEEILLQKTLWPEVQKLYGHGYEIFAIACNHAGTQLASACKAANQRHASIILWNLKNFQKADELFAHNLTVTRLKFSPDDRFLLSVSRDRSWRLFDVSRKFDPQAPCQSQNGTVHTRIIWDCAWMPTGHNFVTVARDKTAIVWNIFDKDDGLKVEPGHRLAMSEAVTAVDVHPTVRLNDASFVVCLGLESGVFHLYSLCLQGGWKLLFNFEHLWYVHFRTDCCCL